MEANPVYISEEDAAILRGNAIRRKDILITRSGANAGQCAIYLENQRAICMSDTLIIRSGNLNPFYLAVFLNAKYGEALVRRGIYGSAQPHIAPPLLYRIPIPNWKRLACEIEKTYIQSRGMKERSGARYAEAETLLLSELGLADWKPKRQIAYVKNYSDARRAERIDADYFQPKYDEIVDAVKAYPGGWDTLGNLVALKKSVEVGSRSYLEEGVPFVRVSNLSPFEITEEKYISTELYAELRQHQPQQGEILLSKDATPGIAHYQRGQPRKMIPAGGILRLQIKTDRVGGEYLTLALNSPLTQQQVERDVGGSVILHWRPEQVAAILIPILLKDKQREIEQKVAESFRLRKRSKELLECAKRAVEIAIEQNEQTAIDWLRQKTEGGA